MPDPAFIVEGHMEQLIVQKLCPGRPVQRLEVNGDDAKISAIVDRIEVIFRVLNNRYFPVCVIFDRERRQETCDVIVDEIKAEIAARGLDINQFRIGVCDRTIENWILADRSLLTRNYGYIGFANFEGTQGKSSLKNICERKERYRETTVGVRLFLQADVKVMYNASASFKSFANIIDFQCWWVEPIKMLAHRAG